MKMIKIGHRVKTKRIITMKKRKNKKERRTNVKKAIPCRNSKQVIKDSSVIFARFKFPLNLLYGVVVGVIGIFVKIAGGMLRKELKKRKTI